MIPVQGTVVPFCGCGECTITVANETGHQEETLIAGQESTCVFANCGVVDVDGRCQSADLELGTVKRKYYMPRWDTGNRNT